MMGVNDVFYIFGNAHQIANIKKLQIFNRWGDFIYEATDLMPNDPTKGWNGRFKDVTVNPGVFVYTAEVEYIDGVVEVVTGDVTVVR
jgi:gliding motility-associated-like protein